MGKDLEKRIHELEADNKVTKGFVVFIYLHIFYCLLFLVINICVFSAIVVCTLYYFR